MKRVSKGECKVKPTLPIQLVLFIWFTLLSCSQGQIGGGSNGGLTPTPSNSPPITFPPIQTPVITPRPSPTPIVTNPPSPTIPPTTAAPPPPPPPPSPAPTPPPAETPSPAPTPPPSTTTPPPTTEPPSTTTPIPTTTPPSTTTESPTTMTPSPVTPRSDAPSSIPPRTQNPTDIEGSNNKDKNNQHSSSKSKSWSPIKIIGISAGGVAALLILVCFLIMCCRRKRRNFREDSIPFPIYDIPSKGPITSPERAVTHYSGSRDSMSDVGYRRSTTQSLMRPPPPVPPEPLPQALQHSMYAAKTIHTKKPLEPQQVALAEDIRRSTQISSSYSDHSYSDHGSIILTVQQTARKEWLSALANGDMNAPLESRTSAAQQLYTGQWKNSPESELSYRDSDTSQRTDVTDQTFVKRYTSTVIPNSNSDMAEYVDRDSYEL